jgi:hypothetical protein
VQVHQIFKHDFEEIVIQGDQLCFVVIKWASLARAVTMQERKREI